MAYVIALPCVDVLDRSCVEACPVDSIYEGERSMYIHPGECIDCGAANRFGLSKQSILTRICLTSGPAMSAQMPSSSLT